MTVSKSKVDMVLARSQMSVREMCEKSGFSRNRFYTILNSKKITPKTAGKLAKALGVPVEEIIETEK